MRAGDPRARLSASCDWRLLEGDHSHALVLWLAPPAPVPARVRRFDWAEEPTSPDPRGRVNSVHEHDVRVRASGDLLVARHPEDVL